MAGATVDEVESDVEADSQATLQLGAFEEQAPEELALVPACEGSTTAMAGATVDDGESDVGAQNVVGTLCRMHARAVAALEDFELRSGKRPRTS